MTDLKKARRQVKHGMYTSAEVLRVPTQYSGAYQDFLSDEKPFNLRAEMALLRVLYLRMEDSLENQGELKVEEIQEKIKEKLFAVYSEKTADKEKLARLTDLCATAAADVIKTEIGLASLGLGLEELANHLEKISRVAERMKKIQEGVKLQVNIDTTILIKFLQEVVFHFVQDRSTRQQMIQRAMSMALPNRPQAELKAAAERPVLTPESINPLGHEIMAGYATIEQQDIPYEEARR